MSSRRCYGIEKPISHWWFRKKARKLKIYIDVKWNVMSLKAKYRFFYQPNFKQDIESSIFALTCKIIIIYFAERWMSQFDCYLYKKTWLLTQLVVFCLRSRRRCWSFGPGPERKAFTKLRVLSRWFGVMTSTCAKYFCKVVSRSETGRLGRASSFCKSNKWRK